MNEHLPSEGAYEWAELSVQATEVASVLRENPNNIEPLCAYMILREAQTRSAKEALLLTIEIGDIKALAGLYDEAADSYLDARVEARNLNEEAIHAALAIKLDNLPPSIERT